MLFWRYVKYESSDEAELNSNNLVDEKSNDSLNSENNDVSNNSSNDISDQQNINSNTEDNQSQEPFDYNESTDAVIYNSNEQESSNTDLESNYDQNMSSISSDNQSDVNDSPYINKNDQNQESFNDNELSEQEFSNPDSESSNNQNTRNDLYDNQLDSGMSTSYDNLNDSKEKNTDNLFNKNSNCEDNHSQESSEDKENTNSIDSESSEQESNNPNLEYNYNQNISKKSSDNQLDSSNNTELDNDEIEESNNSLNNCNEKEDNNSDNILEQNDNPNNFESSRKDNKENEQDETSKKKELLKKLRDRLNEYKEKASKRKKEHLEKSSEEFKESEEDQSKLSDQTNKFLDELKYLPSFEERDRGDGYSIDTKSYTDVPESVIRTLITKFLNQRFCKRNTDLNTRSNSLEKNKGFYKWEVKDVITHLQTHQVTKVLTDKYGYQYAEGKVETVPLSFYFDLSGSMSKYTNMLALIAIELLKKDVKVLLGYNEKVNIQIDKIDKNITLEELVSIIESAGYYYSSDSFKKDSRVTYKNINRNIDNYLVEKKAEKCVVFADFDPISEVINLSQKVDVYWFCFENNFNKYDLSNYCGFIYKVCNLYDLEQGLIKVNQKRFETLCYTENPINLQGNVRVKK